MVPCTSTFLAWAIELNESLSDQRILRALLKFVMPTFSASATRRVFLLLLMLLAGVLLAPVLGAKPSELTLERIAGTGWQMAAVKLVMQLDQARAPTLNFSAKTLDLENLGVRLENLRLRCPALSIRAAGLSCEKGRYHYLHNEREHTGQLTFNYRALSAELGIEFDADDIDAKLRLDLAMSEAAPGTSLTASGIAAQTLMPILAGFIPALEDFNVDAGEVSLRLEFGRSAYAVTNDRVELQLDASKLALSNSSGQIASEDLTARAMVRATLDPASNRWRGTAELSLAAGGIYAEPVYLDLERFPLRAAGQFSVDTASTDFDLSEFSVSQDAVVSMRGQLLSTKALRLKHLAVEIEQVSFPAAYDTWLAGVLVGTPLATLDTEGSANGRFEFVDNQLVSLTIASERLNLEDRAKRFAIYDAAAEINWARRAEDISGSWLSASGGFIYNAGFDATRIDLGIAGEAIDLLDPVRIPLLGGALAIKTFTLRDYGSEQLSLGLEAELEPIDLGQLTLALDWPPFSGELSGRLPLLRYHDGVVTVGGNLEAQAFDGDISIEGLRIEQPFGIVPAISASIRLRNLDLEQVTEVVPFGRVSGRLDGDIEDLRLLKSQPLGFNASFRTPEDDDSRHRLSQRAVDTISRIAGGGAALSSTFLRVFKHFAYDKLGISCRLENDICHMDGVAQADEGYYIVKGALIPRVDLIGRVRKVQWSRLMHQLELALNEGNITVD